MSEEDGFGDAERRAVYRVIAARRDVRSYRPDAVPDEVLLPRHPTADLGPYRRVFRAPVRFDQETAALAFPTRWLDHRIADANPIFRQVFAKEPIWADLLPKLPAAGLFPDDAALIERIRKLR